MSAQNLIELAIRLLAGIGGEIPLQLKQALGVLRCGGGSASELLVEARTALEADPYPPRQAIAEIVRTARECLTQQGKTKGGHTSNDEGDDHVRFMHQDPFR